MYMYVYVYVCVSVSYQDRLEVFPSMRIHVRNPFGLLLGVIETDDAYISWLGP